MASRWKNGISRCASIVASRLKRKGNASLKHHQAILGSNGNNCDIAQKHTPRTAKR